MSSVEVCLFKLDPQLDHLSPVPTQLSESRPRKQAADMKAALLCFLGLGLTVLQVSASSRNSDHASCACASEVSEPEHHRISRAATFRDPGYLIIPRGVKREETPGRLRPARAPKKFYKPKRSRVPREATEYEEEEAPTPGPQRLPQRYAKRRQLPAEQTSPEEEDEEEEEGPVGDAYEKVIPASPMFVNARYHLHSGKVGRGSGAPQTVDLRAPPHLQRQQRMLIGRQLNRAQLFQRIHRDDRNIDQGVESTTTADDETCPDGEEPSSAEGATGYNRTAPNRNAGMNFSDGRLYGLDLSSLPAPARTAVTSLQHMHRDMQVAGARRAGMRDPRLPPGEARQPLPSEEQTATPEEQQKSN